MFKEDLIIIYYYSKVKFNLIPKIISEKEENEFGVRGPTKREGLIASNQASNPKNLFQLRDCDS